MEQQDTQLAQITPGMQVFGIDGEELGTVEAVDGIRCRC